MNSKITHTGLDVIEVNGTPIQRMIRDGSFFRTILELNDAVAMNGYRPTDHRMRVAECIAIGFCDHGVDPPSTMAARMVASCGGSVPNAYISALSMFGAKHAPIERCCEYLKDCKCSGIDSALRKHAPIIAGFGHPIHSSDPRVDSVISEAYHNGNFGEFMSFAQKTEAKIGQKLNYAGAISAICLDNAILPEYAFMLIVIGRMIGLTAHIVEQRAEKGIILHRKKHATY